MGLRNRAEPRCGRMDRPFGLMEPRPITYLVNHVWVLHALLLVLISHSSPELVLKRSESPEHNTTTIGLSLGRNSLFLSFFLSTFFSEYFTLELDNEIDQRAPIFIENEGVSLAPRTGTTC